MLFTSLVIMFSVVSAALTALLFFERYRSKQLTFELEDLMVENEKGTRLLYHTDEELLWLIEKYNNLELEFKNSTSCLEMLLNSESDLDSTLSRERARRLFVS